MKGKALVTKVIPLNTALYLTMPLLCNETVTKAFYLTGNEVY